MEEDRCAYAAHAERFYLDASVWRCTRTRPDETLARHDAALRESDRENGGPVAQLRGNGPVQETAALDFPLVINDQRRVVAELDIAENGSRRRRVRHALRRDLVINPPPYVLRVSLAAIAPPRILLRPLVDRSEYIHIRFFIEELREPRTLFRQASRVLLVALPVLDINFLVHDIHVATQDHLAFFGQFLKMRHELSHETVFGLLPFFTAGPRRHIHRDHR